MKIKQFDRFQHYYLDKIWENCSAGKDVAAQLDRYLLTVEGSMSMEDFIRTLHEKLDAYPAHDPDHGKWRTWGFVVPFHGQAEDLNIGSEEAGDQYVQPLAFEIHETGAVVICVEKREKVLPSSAINDKLMERAKEMADREDRELNRKDFAVLKDEVTASLLKTAPVRRSRIYVMFDGKDLLVFTSSQKAAEETTALIRTAFSSLPTVPAYVSAGALQDFFKQVILRDKDVCSKFQPGTTMKLKSSEGEVITVKDGDIDDARYTDRLTEGFSPVEIELQLLSNLPGMEHIWVKINQKGDIKAFSTSAEADGDEFDTQYERGADGFQSKMAELWVLTRALREFNKQMAETGVMVARDSLSDYMDGDDLAIEKDADAKAKGKAEPTASTEEVDDEDAWDESDTDEEEDDGDI